MSFRRIDAAGSWRGELRALLQFRDALEIDCRGDTDTFARVYGWTREAICVAKNRICHAPVKKES